MKTFNKYLYIIASILAAAGLLASCDSPLKWQEYEDPATTDLPTVYSIRYAAEDTYITKAYMGEIICLLGDNLAGVKEVWFNDRQAILNTSFITDNTLIVAVPDEMPDDATNKIYLVDKKGSKTDVDFQVLPPVPVVNSMSNEWAKEGEVVTLYGKYMFDDANIPLTVSFAGAEVANKDITFTSANEISFKVPAGAQPGYINVNTVSGSGRSKFQYMDSRNMLFDWDGNYGEAHASGWGWRGGVIHAPGTDAWDALDGNYLYFGGATLGPGVWDAWVEDQFCFNYWPEPGNTEWDELYNNTEFAQYIDNYGVAGLYLKFEILIPTSSPWMANGMQLMFTTLEDVSCWDNCQNDFYATVPRYMWEPWYDNGGSYDTADKWITVSFPLSSFTMTNQGKDSGLTFSADRLAGLTFFVYAGAHDGTACEPQMAIDNIRVVPAE